MKLKAPCKSIVTFILLTTPSLIVNTAYSEPLLHHQWGLSNKGQTYTITHDDLTTERLRGTAGEDIGLVRTDTQLRSVKVAVLDSGVDASHPDIQSALIANGKSFVSGRSDDDLSDEDGHGTHVAGIIAARKNGFGILGAAQNALILPIRVITNANDQSTRPAQIAEAVAQGITYAVEQGAEVINMSLGFPEQLSTPAFRRAIELAARRGVLLVAAAGNDSTDQVILPCGLAEVICVGAHGPDGEPTLFSNRGASVDVLAPGLNILSTHPLELTAMSFSAQAGFEMRDGTSMAAPFVSAVLADLLGRGFSPSEARARLLAGARPAKSDAAGVASNLSLQGALGVVERPLIRTLQKESVQLSWDKKKSRLPLDLNLVNLWKEGRSIEVAARVLEAGVSLSRSTWKFESWGSQESKKLQTELLLSGPVFDSEMVIEISIRIGTRILDQFLIKTLVSVPVSQALSSESSGLLVDSKGLPQTRNFEAIHLVQSEVHTEVFQVGVRSLEKGLQMELIRMQSPSVGASSKASLEGSLVFKEEGEWSLESVRRLGDQFALVFKEKPRTMGLGSAHGFLFTNLKFEKVSQFQKLDTTTTFLKENFQWIRYKGVWSPAWYTIGERPSAEKAPFNPWNKDEASSKSYYLYVLTRAGLRTIGLPAKMDFLIAWHPVTLAERNAGSVRAIFAEGENYNLKYFTAELKNEKWSKLSPILGTDFHFLRGLDAKPVLSLSREDLPALGFAGSPMGGSYRGDFRVSFVQNGALRSSLIEARRSGDRVRDVTALFADGEKRYVFALTQYEILYSNLQTGQVISTDQKRFSFLPEILALKAYFAVSVGRSGGKPVPGLFVPPGFLESSSSQVIVPQLDKAGNLVRLFRPASLRLLPDENCEVLPTIYREGSRSWFRVYCGNQIQFIEIKN